MAELDAQPGAASSERVGRGAFEKPVLHLVPDCRPEAGSGHLSRCLALGMAWRRQGGVVTAQVPGLSPLWADRYQQICTTGPSSEARWTVLDSYQTTLRDQHQARGHGGVVVIDDHGSLGAYDADLVVDQNIDDGVDHYATHRGTTNVAVGVHLAMLRPEFAAQRASQRSEPSTVRRILVSLGGAPEATATRLFRTAEDTLAGLGYEMVRLDGEENVASRMRSTDIAVAACGTTAYELACVGVPSILIAVADNQRPVGSGLAAAGAARYLGPVDSLAPADLVDAVQRLAGDEPRRQGYRQQAMARVDGRGADRVVAQIRALEISLRPATVADARTLFEWVNDPVTRSNSFDPTPIAWDDHLRWLTQRVGSHVTYLYIASLDGHEFGQIRFDITQHEAVIDVSIAPDWRGSGLGAPLLVAGVTLLLGEVPEATAVAWVKDDNVASHTSFDRAGFVQDARRPGSLRWAYPTGRMLR